MPDAFISYSRLDKDFVRRLVDSLSRQKRDVWVDWEDIPATADWWNEICTGIDAANAFVFVISPDSVRSTVCRDEIDYALKQSKRFVPILLREVTDPEDLKQMHPAISTHNWVTFHGDVKFEDALQTLVKAVDTDLDYVKAHTRLLVRAREWDTKGRHPSGGLLAGDDLREAEVWLAQAGGKRPEPAELHTQYILASRQRVTNQQRRLVGVAVVVTIFSIILGVVSLINWQIAQEALGQANSRGTQVAQEVTNVAAAQSTAEFNAQEANTQEANAINNYGTALAAQSTAEFNATFAFIEQRRAENSAATATNALGQSQERGTQIAVQVTEVAEARNNAENSAATATNALGISESRGTEIAQQVILVAAAQSTAVFNAAVAQNNAATAEFNATLAYQEQLRAESNAATATNALGQSQERGTQIAVQVTEVAEARNNAESNAATATYALGQAQFRGTQIAVQVTEVAEARSTSIYQQFVAINSASTANAAQRTAVFNATLAYQQQVLAENSAATATNALGISEQRGTQVAVGANSLATREIEAVDARSTAEYNATLAVQEQVRAEENYATAVSAQGTAEYNAEQALGQALAVNAELAIGSGDYDIALALGLESISIRPDLAQAQRVLNKIVYSAARLSYNEPAVAKFSPDGSRLLVSEGNDLLLVDIDSREVVARMTGHTAPVNAANFSADGTRIVSGGDDHLVMLWNAANGTLIRSYAGHEGPVNDVTMTSDGRVILSVSDDTTAISWDATNESLIRRHVNVSSRPIYRVSITPNDANFFIWSGTPDASVMGLWRLSDSARLFETQDPIFSQISSLGNYALSDATRGTLRVYNASSGSVAREFLRDFNWERDVPGARAFNPSGNRVVVSVLNTNTDTPRMAVLDVATGEQIGRFRSALINEEYATALAYNADGSLLLSGYENEIIVWNTATLRPIRHLTAHNETVIEVGFSSDGNYAISRSRDGNVRVWDLSLRDIAESRRIVARTQFAEVNFPGLYNNGQTLAAAVFTSMFAWNAQTGEQINRVDPGGLVINVAHSPVDNLLLMVTSTYTRLLTVPEFSTVRDLFGSEGDRYTSEAAFSPDGTLVVFGSTNNLYVRGVPNGERLATISKADIPDDLEVTGVAITPDNRLLLVVTGDLDTVNALPGEIRVYEIATGEMLYTFNEGHTRTVKTIAVSPTGLTALTGAEDNDLILWNIETGRVLRRFVGHTGQVNRVVYSADGLNALSVSDDTAMIQWDIATGQPLRTFQGHVDSATGLALSEDGRWAVTSTGGDTMIVWQVTGQADLIGFACATRYIPTLSCIDRAQFGLEPCAPDGTPPDDPVCAAVPETVSSTAPSP